MAAPLSVTLSADDHAALMRASHLGDVPASIPAIIDRAALNGDGTRTLRVDRSIAWMLVTSLRGARSALQALEAAYWAAGGPDTSFAERFLIKAAHERGADVLKRSEAA